jgi:hypothetical protein
VAAKCFSLFVAGFRPTDENQQQKDSAVALSKAQTALERAYSNSRTKLDKLDIFHYHSASSISLV